MPLDVHAVRESGNTSCSLSLSLFLPLARLLLYLFSSLHPPPTPLRHPVYTARTSLSPSTSPEPRSVSVSLSTFVFVAHSCVALSLFHSPPPRSVILGPRRSRVLLSFSLSHRRVSLTARRTKGSGNRRTYCPFGSFAYLPLRRSNGATGRLVGAGAPRVGIVFLSTNMQHDGFR